MYQGHFGLREPPFGITPDTSFVYECRAHQEALNVLLVTLDAGEGFVKITGDVGTGKTLLCRRLLSTLDEPWVTAYVPNPLLEPRGLLATLGQELGLKLNPRDDPLTLLQSLNQTLVRLSIAGKRVVVLIDEAQAMPLATLETLRLLSNLETEKHKLLQVVLFGQPELDRNLDNAAVRQLKQRITFHYRLDRLGRAELRHYLRHRLRVAGYAGPQLFSNAAIWLLHRATGGIPRLVNILAHKAMLLVYAEGNDRIGMRHVLLAARDTGAARHVLIPWLV
ncbi:MAG: AAA family ATPase [Betaproteobacteria bacterium]|nr:AAA family ATPase [Betaproteobacteria bacterium]